MKNINMMTKAAKIKLYTLLFVGALLGIVGWGPFSFLSTSSPEEIGSADWIDRQSKMIDAEADNLNINVLKLSLKAYAKIRQEGYDAKELLTIIDYSKPSTERRLWVIDLKNEKVLFNTWVSHGKNSGANTATSFSNQQGSLKSSFGVFLTDDEPYMGGEGYSLRLVGLESGINDNAYRRRIVFHGAWYVAPNVIKQYGQLGRSWGCPAVSEELIRPLINTIKDNTLVFAYYPDQKWLWSSPFLAS